MVILEILRWIGIVALYLLLILFVVLLLVLFLPIKYYGEGTYNKEQQYVLCKARWFWGLIRVTATFPRKPYVSVKILWIEMFRFPAEKEKSTKDSRVQKSEEKIEVDVAERTEATEEDASGGSKVENMSVRLEKADVETINTVKQSDIEENEPKEPIWDKWIGIKEKIQYYINILQEQDTKDVFTHCKVRLGKIFKSIRPRKLFFRGTMGFSSPDTTGYLYGGYCMISSYLGKNVILTPDFDREIIDITGSLKGHITVFVLLWNGIRIYFDKRLMRLIAKLKKGGR